MAKKFDIHPTLEDIFSPLKAKSGIHIKPENKGKFNATKKATGKSTEELTHSKNPVTRKRAIFAKNAASWHHADEGDTLEGPHDPSAIDFSTSYPLAKKDIGGIKPIGEGPTGIQDPGSLDAYKDTQEPQQPKQKGRNPWGTAANDFLIGLTALDAAIPYGRIKREHVVRPPHAYNQYPQGTGSQAIMADGGFVPYNPPFNNTIAHQVAEDKAGAPRHYYHSDDDYYDDGGKLGGGKEPISSTYHNIPTPNIPRRPNNQAIVPSYEFMTSGANKADSSQYNSGFFNAVSRLKNGKLHPFEDKAFYFGDFNGEDVNSRYPNLDTKGASNMFNRGAREAYMNLPKGSFADGGIVQYGGYREADPSPFVVKDEKDNRLTFEEGGEISQDNKDNVLVWKNGGRAKAKAKYGYRMHQDPTRNRPTFENGGEMDYDEDDNVVVWEDGGYIRALNRKGKVIPNIMANGGGISPAQAKSDRPYNQMTYYDKDIVAANGAKISHEQAVSDYPYTQLWYENGGILPSTYGKDEDANKLVFAMGGPMSMPGATGFMASRGPSDGLLRKKRIKNKAEEGGRYIARGLGGNAKKYRNGEYLDAFDDNMLLTAEYRNGGKMPMGGDIGPGEVPKVPTIPGATGQNNGYTPDDRHQAYLIDAVNYRLTHGKSQKITQQMSPEENQLMTSAYIWSKRADQMKKMPQQVIQDFYARPTQGDPTGRLRQRLNSIGGGAVAMYNSTPNVEVADRKMADGGEVSKIIPGPLKFHYGGDADGISLNPYAGPTVQFKGPSHEEGGIGISYGGKKVEVEGGETGIVDSDGDFNVMGNMVFPGTDKKFKTISKDIAKKENSANRKMKQGQKLLDEANPDDAYDYLRFNSGRANTLGANMKMKQLASQREQLADVQKTILDTANDLNIDPSDLSKGKYTKLKAKKGASIPYGDDGITVNDNDGDDKKPSRSDRNHNPGNLKYGPFAKAHGATGQDKDGFAIFDTQDVGDLAMRSLLQSKSYNNMSVDKAISKWTAGKPYQYNLGPLSSKRVGDLSGDEFDKVVDTMTKGEGTRYGEKATPRRVGIVNNTPPSVAGNTPTIKYDPSNPPSDPFKGHYYQANRDPDPLPDLDGSYRNPPSSTRYNKFDPTQISGELYTLATNRQVPVPSQKFTPTLLQPYSVSFQDRLNENRDTFNAEARNLDFNPSALAALGAQKYAADNSVKAEEFRTNQGISQEIANKNTEILNQAQQENLKLADTQMVRQAEARAKTRAQAQEALSSISSKILQNRLENRRIQLYEPLFDYRYEDTDGDGKPDSLVYEGGPANFDFSGIKAFSQGTSGDPNSRMTTVRDKEGNVKYTRESTRPLTDSELKQIELYQKQRRMYLPPRQ